MIDQELRKRVHRPIVRAIQYVVARYDLAAQTEPDPRLMEQAGRIIAEMTPEEIAVLRALLRQVEG